MSRFAGLAFEPASSRLLGEAARRFEPELAIGTAHAVTGCNTHTTGLHLVEIGKAIAPGASDVIIACQAGWHSLRPS